MKWNLEIQSCSVVNFYIVQENILVLAFSTALILRAIISPREMSLWKIFGARIGRKWTQDKESKV